MTGTTIRSSRPGAGPAGRPLALLLGLLTIVATLAAPVQADDHEAAIASPEPGEVISETLELEAHATPGVAINYAVRTTATDDEDCSVSYDVNGIARDVSGELTTDEAGVWSESLDVRGVEAGLYCFAFEPADAPRTTVTFTIASRGDDHQIVSPAPGEVISETLELEAHATPGVAINYAVRTTAADDEDCSVSYDVNGIERDVNGSTSTDGDGTWTRTIDVTDVEPGRYCFAFDPADASRISVAFTIGDVEVQGELVEQCYPEGIEQECTIEITSDDGQSFNVRTTVRPKTDDLPASLKLSLPDNDVADAVSEACNGLLTHYERIGGSVAHLVPAGFDAGSLTVTTRIPRALINEDVSRGNPHFQVCVAPTDDEAGAYPTRYQSDLSAGSLGGGLAGPILLDDCASAGDTACVEDRQRVGEADLRITFRLPTADPYFR